MKIEKTEGKGRGVLKKAKLGLIKTENNGKKVCLRNKWICAVNFDRMSFIQVACWGMKCSDHFIWQV